MLLLDWYRQWVEIRRENNRENELIETLKHELEMLRHERDTLLGHTLRGNQQEIKTSQEVTEFKPIPARNMPWAVRRQILEENDRAKAKLLNSKMAVTTTETTVDDLEQELNIVAQEREGKDAVR